MTLYCAHCNRVLHQGEICKCIPHQHNIGPDWKHLDVKPLLPRESKPSEPITILGQATSYTLAVANWIAAGRPTRTEAEILHILEVKCQTCEQYNVEKQACKRCGCKLNRSKNALRNKIAMATENCPIGRW